MNDSKQQRLEDFVTPIGSGVEPCEPQPLDPAVARELDEQCRALERHRAAALVASRSYVVTGPRS
jgi:hypothetical protein